MFNRFTLGSLYRVGKIDTEAELIPQTSSFKARENEQHIFEKNEKKVSFEEVVDAIQSGYLNERDIAVLTIVAVFSSAACTTRTINELLILQNIHVTKALLESSVKRLQRLNLINFSRFQNANGTQPSLRIITLTTLGSQLANSLDIPHRFNPAATFSAKPYQVKSRTETAQLICNWLKNLSVDSFEVRPVIVVNPKDGAIIRPAATITVWGEKLYFEVPRRHDGWLEDIVEKFERYKKVFKGKTLPTVVVNGEDLQMNLEVYKAVCATGYTGDVLFTEDLSTFGPLFKTSLYAFNSNNIIRYKFNKAEREAV